MPKRTWGRLTVKKIVTKLPTKTCPVCGRNTSFTYHGKDEEGNYYTSNGCRCGWYCYDANKVPKRRITQPGPKQTRLI